MMLRRALILSILMIVVIFGSEIFDKVENTTIPIQTYQHIKSKEIQTSSFIVYPGSLNPSNLGTCKKLNKTEFGANFSFPPGSAILVFAYEGCSHKDHAKLVQDAGGSIALIASGIPYLDSSFKFGIEELNIPVLFLTFTDATSLIKTMAKNSAKNQTTTINFTKEYSTWVTLGKGGFWIFLEIVLLLSYLFNYILGIRSLYLHFKDEGFRFNIAQTTIWVNLISTFIFAMVIFDPLNVRYIADQTYCQVMYCLASPALLTSVLLLSFFFNEVLIAKGFIKPQLSTLKYPFLIVCLTFWACYIANAYFFGAYLTNFDIVKIVSFMNILFFGLTGFYFLAMSVLILIRLKTYDSPIFKRVIPLVSVVLLGVTFYVCAAIIEVVQLYSTYFARKTFATWTLMLISSVFILTPQFVYFREPNNSSKTSNKMSSSNKMNSKPSSPIKLVEEKENTN